MSRPLPSHRQAIAELIPHQGDMCLLEAVLSMDDEHIVCRSQTHLEPGHVLRVHGQLSSVVLCEYGAQAVAVHGALQSASGGVARPGMLVALRDIQLATDYVNHHRDAVSDASNSLLVRAEREHSSETGCMYRFTVSLDQPNEQPTLLASGKVTIMNGSAP